MSKLYCYVDETGQDTTGRFFLAALILTGQEQEELRIALTRIEQNSGKGQKKWTKATLRQKSSYIEQVINLSDFQGKILYAEFRDVSDYLSCIIEAIVKCINKKAPRGYKAVILIDGLERGQRLIVGARLRRERIKVEKVRGPRDEGEPLIRLADAAAGFVRDALEKQIYASPLYQKALQNGMIRRLQ